MAFFICHVDASVSFGRLIYEFQFDFDQLINSVSTRFSHGLSSTVCDVISFMNKGQDT